MVWAQIESVAIDLETFSRHAGRTTITTDDVLLVCRRNEALQGIIKDFVDQGRADAERKKAKSGAKGVGKGKAKD
jgi:centromere protein S